MILDTMTFSVMAVVAALCFIVILLAHDPSKPTKYSDK